MKPGTAIKLHPQCLIVENSRSPNKSTRQPVLISREKEKEKEKRQRQRESEREREGESEHERGSARTSVHRKRDNLSEPTSHDERANELL